MSKSGKVEPIPRRIRNWLKEQMSQLRQRVVEEVPEDIVLCEFDCRKTQCLFEEWEHCERRLRHLKLRHEYEEGR